MSVDTMGTFKPDALAWQDEPILPKGAKSVLLVGDPTKAGVFIAYLKFPPNYIIPPHTHPFAEVVTVLSGKAGNGMGEKFDNGKGELLTAGSGFSLPADHAHYLWTTDEETIVQLSQPDRGGLITPTRRTIRETRKLELPTRGRA